MLLSLMRETHLCSWFTAKSRFLKVRECYFALLIPSKWEFWEEHIQTVKCLLHNASINVSLKLLCENLLKSEERQRCCFSLVLLRFSLSGCVSCKSCIRLVIAAFCQWFCLSFCLPFHWDAGAYLGYGKHGSCHGRHFDGGAKIAWPT